MIQPKFRSVLITIAAITPFLPGFAQAQNITDEDIRPAWGEYQPNPNRSNITRDMDIFLSNLDGVDADVDYPGWFWDYFLQYYVPPADGYINSIDFHFSDVPNIPGKTMLIWIYEANYPWNEINTEAIADRQGDAWLGYYDELSGFEVVGSNWIYGGINDTEGAIADKVYDPLGGQVWPETGSASLSVPPNVDDEGWLSLDLLDSMGTVYSFERNVPFIVITTYIHVEDSYGPNWRSAFYAAQKHVEPQPTMKFHGTNSEPDGWTGNNDWGWYILSYVWDWDVNVTLTGDRGPVMSNWTELGVALDQGSRTITVDIFDDNPAGGTFGIESASLMYAIDGSDYTIVALTENDTAWTANIPGHSGEHIDYYLTATDVNGLTTTTPTIGYDIFFPSAPTLVVFNGGSTTGYPYEYYFGVSDFLAQHVADFPHDVWSEKIYPELATAYSTIYEFFISNSGGQSHDNRDVIHGWIAEGDKNYFFAGDDFYKGTVWDEVYFEAGDFEYDVFGVYHIYNNISDSRTSTTDIEAVADNVLTGGLYTAHNAVGDTLVYDPVSEIDGYNGLDGFDPINLADVNMTIHNGLTAIGMNREVDGDKIVFLGFDPLSINARPYTWWGFDVLSPQTQSLVWFGVLSEIVKIEERSNFPSEFKLAQNYPNPFNPSTIIEYDLPEECDVLLIIYDMNGRLVRTLVSRSQSPGNYQVQWNGTDQRGLKVGSGMYFTQIKADDQSQVIKMLYLK